MLFDAHCHAWRRWPYDTAVPDPETRGSIEALLYEMDTHDVERAAVVCARIGGGAGGAGFANDDNNDYVARFAAAHPDRITPWVDVDCLWREEHHSPGAADRLRAEIERTGAGGFTHYVTPDANDGWLASDDAGEFFRFAADSGLIASLALSAAWFGDLRPVAAANPGLPVLIHHMSHPSSAVEFDALVALGDLPNVGVKISGFNYNASEHWEFPYPEAQEIFRAIVDGFGSERLYWGSDFPASRDHLTYRQSIEAVLSHADFLSPGQLAGIMGDNLATLVAEPRLTTLIDNDPNQHHPTRK
ncbi:amidohydrolase family protein [Lacisediminihabitans profunda]|uniref:Amidohydrolase n=1 Tax=Lacisediminihabitans profunda TaxID=2594790 RepID=A0A5C8UMC8_9MICO|nr:amidohydrolase family protein [Lacisediminihabitans profunda]TXN29483.1 amidohydrolase [Lacisediminihabitans profunda]